MTAISVQRTIWQAPNFAEILALASLVVPIDAPGDPVEFLARASAALGDGAFWAQPEAATAFAGAGVAAEAVVEGPERFAAASAALRDLSGVVQRQDAAVFPVLAGFAFRYVVAPDGPWRGFPAGRLIVPEVVLQVTPAGAFLRATTVLRPGQSPTEVQSMLQDRLSSAREWLTPPPTYCIPARAQSAVTPADRQAWEGAVSRAVAAIAAGRVAKVVLAREERQQAEQPISPFDALTCLGEEHPGATLFAFSHDDAWFIGATPERLVRLRDGVADVTCLAGSISIGATPEETAALADQLLASAKDRHEHEIVVSSTIDALSTVSASVERMRGTPRVRQARSVQHLETPLAARAHPESDVLQLAGLLHPTPAVGGFPTAPALELITELESFDRGWYAGPVGWVDLNGAGEFSVAIRSARIAGHVAHAFAGGGIVADSQPAAEFHETELKLRPMKAALGAL
ncbi:MAG: isochorismate synthase [Thermomicrobiales bacterium]